MGQNEFVSSTNKKVSAYIKRQRKRMVLSPSYCQLLISVATSYGSIPKQNSVIFKKCMMRKGKKDYIEK